jgi:hypothetical protein
VVIGRDLDAAADAAYQMRYQAAYVGPPEINDFRAIGCR